MLLSPSGLTPQSERMHGYVVSYTAFHKHSMHTAVNIALAQINATVGHLESNVSKIIEYARRAKRQGADLVIFPELCLTGYPPQDLLENHFFIQATQRSIEHLCDRLPHNVGLLIGAPVPNESPVGKRMRNAALLIENGQVIDTIYKTLLPTYDIFDEHRYFESAETRRVVHWRGLNLGVHICEDMWNSQQQQEHRLYNDDPIAELAAQDIDLLVNISASPFSVGKHERRNELIRHICDKHKLPFVFVNTVGANTEIIFDGDSRVHQADGTQVRCAASFEEELMHWEFGSSLPSCEQAHSDVKDLHDALVLGIRDYFTKTNIFSKALIGLSGGIDSAVTCALATRALGADNIVGVTMPSKYSSEGSVADSKQLASNLGIEFHHIPIDPAVNAFGTMLHDQFEGTEEGVAEENIQARSRGLTLMALSNKFDYLLLSTGNKSEMAVGYATLYGDMSGGVSVLSDVLKTDVYHLAEYINQTGDGYAIPPSTIEKPPSAELAPGQKDQDTLPPYETLDAILRRYIEEKKELDSIVAETGIDEDVVAEVLRMVDTNEYKRRQAPPGLRVSDKAFGSGRRLPIVMHWDRQAVARPAVK